MKSRTLTFTSAITLFAALALPAQLAAQHNTSGTNGQIAFTRQITTDAAGIFIANPDGSHEQQVPLGGTDGVEIFSDVHWSPDGRELLIGHTLRIDPSTGQCCLPFRPAIVKPDGSDYKVLTMPYAPFDGGCRVWSLDQTRLLCGFGGDHPGIFSVRSSDGGDPLRLTTYPYGGKRRNTNRVPSGEMSFGTSRASVATLCTLHARSQSARRCRSSVKVEKQRMGSGSRSVGTAT
jgi:hypothetical protein